MTTAARDNLVRLPSLHEGQRHVRENMRRFNWLAAGRRWRKTTLGMSLAVEGALQGMSVLWGAPVYDEVMIAWDEARKAADRVARFQKADRICQFPNAGRIIYRSLDDPDNARGHTIDRAIIDECATVIDKAWYEVIRPMLMDTKGDALLMGTPKGKNWFYRECLLAQEKENSMFFNAPSLGVELLDDHTILRRKHTLENPNITFEEVEDIYHTTPRIIFEQEILALFKDEAGGVFRNIDNCIDKGRDANEDKEIEHAYFMGVDLARLHDFTVIIVVRDDGRMVYFDRFSQISWALQIERIVNTAKMFNPYIVIDANSIGDPLIEQIRGKLYERNVDAILEPFHITAQSKGKLIEGLSMAIEHGQVRLMDIPQLIRELQDYQYELTNAGNIKMNAPRGSFDDTVIALALAATKVVRYSNPLGSLIQPQEDLWGALRTNGREIWDGYSRGYERSHGW